MNGREESEVFRASSRQLLPVARGSSQMSLAFLLRACRVSFVARIAIGHQRTREMFAQQIARHLAAA